jgi:hypothetical protein
MQPDSERTFERPYRTVGVRLFNAVGRCLRRWGLRRPLSLYAILDRACRQARLTDGGDESFHQPLRVLLQSCEADARLSPLGRLMMRFICTHHVKTRLRLHQVFTALPSIRERPIRRPLFIVGLPRTGTTLLHRLLCQDRRARPLLLWEALEPAPPPDLKAGKPDPRVKRARQFVSLTVRHGAPALQQVHPMDPEGPEECTFLLFNTFRTPAFALNGCVSGYLQWLRGRADQDAPVVYEEYRRQLQLLQGDDPAGHWVLKSPVHGWGLDALLRLFPDACVIQTHRDMNEVVPSVCSLFALSRGLYSDDVDCRSLGAEIPPFLAHDLVAPMVKARAAHPGRVFDVHYSSLVRDPLAAVGAIYDRFGLSPDEGMQERMRQWLAGNPADKHGKHCYDLEQFGLSAREIEKWFGGYAEQMGIAAGAQARQGGVHAGHC